MCELVLSTQTNIGGHERICEPGKGESGNSNVCTFWANIFFLRISKGLEITPLGNAHLQYKMHSFVRKHEN